MENGENEARDPSGFLSAIIGAPVTVKLNSGTVYRGTLAAQKCYVKLRTCLGELQSVDGYMNIALEQTKEYINGQLSRTYGDAFIRGNNGIKLFRYHEI
jgi:U6 snRNA-associated Sm-like protein LSm6